MVRANDPEIVELAVEALFSLCIPSAPLSSNLTDDQLESLEVFIISLALLRLSLKLFLTGAR